MWIFFYPPDIIQVKIRNIFYFAYFFRKRRFSAPKSTNDIYIIWKLHANKQKIKSSLNISIYFKSRLISRSPLHLRISLTLEKCLHPKNPLWTLNGDGCGASKTICLLVSISSFFFWANAHRNRNMIHCFLSEIVLITASVKICHQISLWEFGVSFMTVRLAFNRNTHCSARLVRFQLTGGWIPKSSWSSLKIFFNEGGCLTPSCTEKHNPCASHSPWYGSCPRMTILTLSKGVRLNALKISDHLG